MEKFERDSKNGYRYPSSKGQVSAEDLWGFDLDQLDYVAVTLYEKVEAGASKVSFVKKKRKDKTDEYKLEIVKRIIEVKLEELEAAERAAENKKRREKLLEILEDKLDGKDRQKSIKELKKELRELDD